MKAVSDSYLNQMWRKAVMAVWGYRCGLCWMANQALECHHIVRRRKVITRWDWRNGIPLCPQCHALAHTKKGELLLSERSPYYGELVELEQRTYKTWLVERGKTDNEFRVQMLSELKAKVGGER